MLDRVDGANERALVFRPTVYSCTMDKLANLPATLSTASPLTLISSVFVFGLCLWFIRPQIQGPLRGYPGPFLAGKKTITIAYINKC